MPRTVRPTTPSIATLKRQVHRLERHLHQHQAHPDYTDYRLSPEPRLPIKEPKDSRPKLVLKRTASSPRYQGKPIYIFARHQPVDMDYLFLPEYEQWVFRLRTLTAHAHGKMCMPGFQYSEVSYGYIDGDMGQPVVVSHDFADKALNQGWIEYDAFLRSLSQKPEDSALVGRFQVSPDGMTVYLVRPTPEGQADGRIPGPKRRWPVYTRTGRLRGPQGLLVLPMNRALPSEYYVAGRVASADVNDWYLRCGVLTIFFRK